MIQQRFASFSRGTRPLGERLAGLPVDQQRAVIHDALEQRAARTGLVVEHVAQVEDLTVPVADDTIRLRVYTPFGDGPHPAFLHIHGGGFLLGSIDWVYNHAKCAHICRARRMHRRHGRLPARA